MFKRLLMFFNLDLLEKESKTDQLKFLALLEYHYRGSLPNKNSKYKPSVKSLRGHSFILNPEPLFNQDTMIAAYLVQYIKLAGRRSWLDYELQSIRTLDTSYFPDIDLAKLKTNPLLTVTKQLIYFKFEETYNGKNIR